MLKVCDHDGVVVDIIAYDLDRVAANAGRAQCSGVVDSNVDLATDGLVETGRFGGRVGEVLFVLVKI